MQTDLDTAIDHIETTFLESVEESRGDTTQGLVDAIVTLADDAKEEARDGEIPAETQL
jgi:hypothetical protein